MRCFFTHTETNEIYTYVHTLSLHDALPSSGQTLLLSGKMLTGRDAAHKRIQDMLEKGEPLPVDFTNRVIYYVGQVDPVGSEVCGPAGPTWATRRQTSHDMMVFHTGLISMRKTEEGCRGK